MDTVIIILVPNEKPFSFAKEVKDYIKTYVGTSRYSETNDDEGYQDAVVVDGVLSSKEKTHLVERYKDKLEMFFIESEDDPFDDEQTIKIK